MVSFRAIRHQRRAHAIRAIRAFNNIRSNPLNQTPQRETSNNAASETMSNNQTNMPASQGDKADTEPARVQNLPANNELPGFDDLPINALWNMELEPDNTFRIVYKGIIGVKHPSVNGGDGLAFEYPERVPSHLCFRGVGIPAPVNCNQTAKYIADVISRHNASIMNTRQWECQFCGERAREMCHSPIPFLSPAINDTADFRPYIWDFVVPICRSMGGCDKKAEQLVIELANKNYDGPVHVTGPTCQKCGSLENLKTCGRCFRVKYCSRPCQVEDWPKHKHNCRLAQKEAAQKEAAKKELPKEKPGSSSA